MEISEELIKDIKHNVNNPLTIISLLVQRGKLDDRAMEGIKKNADRIADYIKDLEAKALIS